MKQLRALSQPSRGLSSTASRRCASVVWRAEKPICASRKGEISQRTMLFASCLFPPLSPLDTRHSPLFSLDHSIRPRQHVGRNREADLLRGLEIDDELELDWLFHRQLSGLSAFQNLVHVRSGAPETLNIVG
jgi:hypothetical protein